MIIVTDNDYNNELTCLRQHKNLGHASESAKRVHADGV